MNFSITYLDIYGLQWEREICPPWEYEPPGFRYSRQKVFFIRERPFLVVVDIVDGWPPAPPGCVRLDPPSIIHHCQAILLVYREDIPQSFQFLKAFRKAMKSHWPSWYIFHAMTTPLLSLHESRQDGTDNPKGYKFSKSMNSRNHLRLSGPGYGKGFDSVIKEIAIPFYERFYGPRTPSPEVLHDYVITEDGKVQPRRPSLLTRLLSCFM